MSGPVAQTLESWALEVRARDAGHCTMHHQWFTAEGDAPFVSVTTGTLDDTSAVAVDVYIWTQHKQPWVTFADGSETWPQAMPPERFRNVMMGGAAPARSAARSGARSGRAPCLG